jgi:hypothetical protein
MINCIIDRRPRHPYYFYSFQTKLWADRVNRSAIFKQSKRAGNREGLGLSYRPARLHSTQPCGLVPWNRTIHGLLKSLKFRAQAVAHRDGPARKRCRIGS